MTEKELFQKFRAEFSSGENLRLFLRACRLTQTANINSNISSHIYTTEFFKWIKPQDARNKDDYISVIEAATKTSYSNFEKWQSTGTPVKGEYALLCFTKSAKYRDKKLEKFFAEFLNKWIVSQISNEEQPDFSDYETVSKNLIKKYIKAIDEHPFAAQLQRYLHSQSYERKTIISDIREFIDTHDSGYVLIEGGAGMGKSWLTAYTAKTLYDSGDYQCVWHFNELASGHSRSADLLNTLFSQLKDIYPCLDTKQLNSEYERVLNTNSGYGNFYRLMFDQLAYDKNFHASKLIIFVDALDEVSKDDPSRSEPSNTLFLPKSLINNVFIFTTSRSFGGEDYEGKKHPIRLTKNNSHQINDIEGYIRQRSKDRDIANWINRQDWESNDPIEAFVKMVAINSRSTFIYVYLVFRDINQFDKKDAVPDGIDGFYKKQIERISYDNSIKTSDTYLVFDALLRMMSCSSDIISAYSGVNTDTINSICESAIAFGLLSKTALPPVNLNIYQFSHRSLASFIKRYEYLPPVHTQIEKTLAVFDLVKAHYIAIDSEKKSFEVEGWCSAYIFFIIFKLYENLRRLNKTVADESEIFSMVHSIYSMKEDLNLRHLVHSMMPSHLQGRYISKLP